MFLRTVGLMKNERSKCSGRFVCVGLHQQLHWSIRPMLWSTLMHAYMYACKYRMHTLMHTPFVNELLHILYIHYKEYYMHNNILLCSIYTSGDPHIVQNSPM